MKLQKKAALLPLPHVQFRKTENTWRLDHSYRGSHRRDIPRLVDASGLRAVNAGHSISRALCEKWGFPRQRREVRYWKIRIRECLQAHRKADTTVEERRFSAA